MSYITLKCKNCGANMSLNTDSNSATCIHCGSTFLISEILDEKDFAFMSKFSKKELEQKMMANDALKQAETFLYQGDFEKSEAYFKRAIELDDSNYKCYLGVVKAKTQNLNKLPDNDDYIQYAHYALSLASGDDLILVKSELSKLDLLEYEQKRQRRTFISRQKQEESYRKHKREVRKFFSFIAVFILLMFGATIFINSMFSGFIFNSSTKKHSVNIDSYDSLLQVFSDEKYLNYDINLTANIDCNGNKITPYGSSTKPFIGSFNGNNFKVSNAVIENNSSNNVGLFGYTVLANISNLVLDNIELNIESTDNNTSNTSYGLLIGSCESSVIQNIEIKNTCSINIQKNIYYSSAIGGLVGSISNGSFISNISCHTNINSVLTQDLHPVKSFIGGIIGTTQSSVIQKTCSNSNINATLMNNTNRHSDSFVSGIVGYIFNPTETDLFNITYNNFSGKINTLSSNLNCNIGAITCTNRKTTRFLHNYCLYTPDKFKSNSNNILYTKLTDYTKNEELVSFCISNDTYLSKVHNIFHYWKYSDTFEPNLQ